VFRPRLAKYVATTIKKGSHFNWPKAGPLYARAEELFKKNNGTRDETYARVEGIRALWTLRPRDMVSDWIIAFLEGNSRRAAVMVGNPASGISPLIFMARSKSV
jgi:hypothetical protein